MRDSRENLTERVTRFRPSVYFSKDFKNVLRDFVSKQNTFSSAKQYYSSIKNFCDYIEKDFFEMEASDVDKYFSMVSKMIAEKKMTEATYNIKRCHLANMADYINQNHPQYSVINHFRFLKPMRYYQGLKSSCIPELDDMDYILEKAKEESYMAYTIIVLAFRTGRKASDIIELREKDITEMNGVTTLTLTGKNPVTITIPKDVAKILKTYMNQRNRYNGLTNSNLFLNKWGNPLTLRNLDALIKKVMTRAGKGYTVKDLRARAILDMVAAADTAEELEEVRDYTGIQDLRFESYISAVSLADKSPAERVNIRIISGNAEEKEEQQETLI